MASVFKRGGKKNRYGQYLGQFVDEHGRIKRWSTGTTDKDAALQIANKWETDASLRRQGVIDESQARFAEQNRRPLSEHVAEYIGHCEHAGQNRVHVGNKKTQLNAMVSGIGASRLSDLEPHKVESYLASLVRSGKSHRTHNQHRATTVSFMQWCFEHRRVVTNALTIVPTLNEAKDRRRVRRALTADELSRLIAVSIERRVYYLFAYYTGLRVKAAKAAVWGDVDFESATIRVRVGNAKGKREDTFYNLHPQLLAELEQIKPPFASPTAPIFSRVPTVRTFHRDCKRAGIERYDVEGRQLDRHALRTTLGTDLAKAGVSPQIAMKVMGHTDVRITMKHYTDLRLVDTAKAVHSLPRIEPKHDQQAEPTVLQATGTDDATTDAITDENQRQRKRQLSGGISQHPVTASGIDSTADSALSMKMPTSISTRKNRANDHLGHDATARDLMIGVGKTNMQKLRAVGAVG